MAQFVRFIGRREPSHSPATTMLGTVHPAALAAMKQTGEMVSQKTGQGLQGSQRFLQGGLSAPITVTWEITAACNIACIHCLSSSGRRRPRERTMQQSLALIDEVAEMQVVQSQCRVHG